jgi:hypothetical protein
VSLLMTRTKAPPSDLVDQTEIARRAGVKVGTVRMWRQRHPDFPEPDAVLSIGPVWVWSKVAPWVAVDRPTGRPRR